MDSKINNNTYGGVNRPTSRVLAPPGGRSWVKIIIYIDLNGLFRNIFFGGEQNESPAEPGINQGIVGLHQGSTDRKVGPWIPGLPSLFS